MVGYGVWCRVYMGILNGLSKSIEHPSAVDKRRVEP